MSLRTRLHELQTASGGPRAMARKAADLGRSVRTLLDGAERRRRMARLQRAGLMGEAPNTWQLVQGAHHMMMGFILPSNIQFYEHYQQDHWWQQVIRFLDEPSAMIDPIGLGISQQMLISHLIQVVHTSAGYDVALLMMFDDGLAPLRAELEQLIAGEHPRQAAIDAILERPEYPQRLLEALDRFEQDPVAHWRVSTVDAPEDCEAFFAWGIELFGTPGRLMSYSTALPPTVGESLRSWLSGDLGLPTPA